MNFNIIYDFCSIYGVYKQSILLSFFVKYESRIWLRKLKTFTYFDCITHRVRAWYFVVHHLYNTQHKLSWCCMNGPSLIFTYVFKLKTECVYFYFKCIVFQFVFERSGIFFAFFFHDALTGFVKESIIELFRTLIFQSTPVACSLI